MALILFTLLFATPILILYGTWAWAVVIKKTWLWFAVPAFAVNPITFTQAIAISIFVSVFFVKSMQIKSNTKPDGRINWSETISQVITGMIMPWFVLFLNFILSCIFM